MQSWGGRFDFEFSRRAKIPTICRWDDFGWVRWVTTKRRLHPMRGQGVPPSGYGLMLLSSLDASARSLYATSLNVMFLEYVHRHKPGFGVAVRRKSALKRGCVGRYLKYAAPMSPVFPAIWIGQ
jgi:hypothetical protein